MLLILTETTSGFKQTSQTYINIIDMGTKYCQKQPMFNKVVCWVEDMFPEFLSVLCILCFHVIFFIFI